MRKKALLFLKKKKQKDFCEFQPGELRMATPSRHVARSLPIRNIGYGVSNSQSREFSKFFWRQLISRGPVQTSLRSVIGTRVHKKVATFLIS